MKNVIVTIGDIFDHVPLFDSWKYFDEIGLSEWCMNEGLATREDTHEISHEIAERYDLVKYDIRVKQLFKDS